MEFLDHRFAHPVFILTALLIPVGIWIVMRRVRTGTLKFSSVLPFRGIQPSLRVRARFLPPVLRIIALLLLIVALARPQKGSELAPERSRGIGILLVIDTSGSMLEQDFQYRGETVSRIDAVKPVVRDFIAGGKGLGGRPNDEIGIVAFTGYPVPMAPLTLDHGAILEVLDSLEAADANKINRNSLEKDRHGRPVYPEEFRTAIGDALAKGAERLKEVDVKSKVMILLSDGSQNHGALSPQEGAQIAAGFDIKVYTIGIGQSGIIMQTVQTLLGPVKQPRRSDLDEDTLKEIAAMTGGKYFNAADTNALRMVYEEIDELERSEIETHRFYRWDEKFQPLALAGLCLIVLEILLSQTLFRRVP